MSFSAIKRNLTDRLFSKIVREKANWNCERCLRNFENQKSIFDASHYITRGNKRVRWDFQNVLALCRGCHQYFSKNPYDHTKFMEKKLGAAGLGNLIFRSHRNLIDSKIDEKFFCQGFKIELKRILESKKSDIIGAR